jgi:protease YdgD
MGYLYWASLRNACRQMLWVRQWARLVASFARGAIIASMFLVAIPESNLADQVASDNHREPVDVNSYPWSSVGKVGVPGVIIIYHCTGAVIAADQFLTAGHCFYDEMNKRFVAAAAINFLLGFSREEYRLHRRASRYMVPAAFDPHKRETSGDDWAVVNVDQPFPADVKPLRLATKLPLPGTAIKTAGYGIPRLFLMTADKECETTGLTKKLVIHNCIINGGDSGGPILNANEQEEGLIWAINSGRALGDEAILPKEGGVAVSAASIADFLLSHPVGSPERREMQ